MHKRTPAALSVSALLFLFGPFLAMPLAADPLDVIASEVVESGFSDPLEALGTLKARESSDLTASVTDTIAEVRFEDGQRVERGEILVVMTSREQQAQLEEAEADVVEAERQYERLQSLVEREQASRSELDEQRRALDTAAARLRAVEARLSDRLIVAPFDGVLGLRDVSVGTLLSPGDPVATLHDDSEMKLDFAVPERFLQVLQPGTLVSAESRAWPDLEFEGEISAIDNQVDPVTRAIQVRARVPNPDGKLRPGMLMLVEIELDRRQALVIPEEALLPEGQTHHVFLVTANDDADDRAERREVRIGSRRPGEVEILEGLEQGDIVVSHGGLRLSDDQAVRVRNDMDAGESLADALRRGRNDS